ncbi:MAG TPA: NADH-quinone oxidoreductase subunit NuoE [Firmicutes bacterium]|nr:NADH-quinone oxidoreductase subunit NuoE [Bacillota bacterium]
MISPSDISSIKRLDNGHKNRDIDTEVVDRILSGYASAGASSLIPILQDLQESFGYLPEVAIDLVGRALDISTARIYGVATFYNQFRLNPLGKHVIRVCRGTACHVKGSLALLETLESELGIKAGGTTKDGMFSVETVACLGACSIAPAVMVDDKFSGRLTVKQMPRLVKQIQRDEAKLAKSNGGDAGSDTTDTE